ncbi:hypothetical protein ACFSKU_17155 [Pontibacter silvestris]|uniref:Uncharacterized protein n=1 Tax=Pontibacter silvestris TaxID=2305183 RepID=A0ABW4X200_9BACT|nr:hypothetical protein [Pontibacter silvestris]MCC9135752.1 hypothetical protein [Pontibacter silvestris]
MSETWARPIQALLNNQILIIQTQPLGSELPFLNELGMGFQHRVLV